MGKNFMAQLQKHEGYIARDRDINEGLIRMPTPSVGFAFGPPHGLRRGCSLALGGISKGGKSFLFNAIAGQLHKDDPEAWVIKYDTEFRDEGQLTREQAKVFGIDLERYVSYSVNTPDGIFDHLAKDVTALCQDGMKLGLVGIDSLNNIQGIRTMNNDSVMDQTIGDLAQTLPAGMKRILPMQKKFRVGMVYVVQIRTEMDQLEIRRGNKVRFAMPHTVQHMIDYWAYIEPNRNKEGRTDLAGNEMVNENLTDLAGNSDQTGHKIRFKLKESSYGIKGRVGEFSIDYRKGIINISDEVFLLGTNRGVISRPNNLTYEFRGQKWTGKPATLEAIKNSKELQEAIVKEVYSQDTNPKDDDAEISSENE